MGSAVSPFSRRMNADLHMAGDVENTGAGNLFVIFGEPDTDILLVRTDGDQPGQIHRGAWETLHSDTSRPFDRPPSGRIAVNVISDLGDEVMKVFRV